MSNHFHILMINVGSVGLEIPWIYGPRLMPQLLITAQHVMALKDNMGVRVSIATNGKGAFSRYFVAFFSIVHASQRWQAFVSPLLGPNLGVNRVYNMSDRPCPSPFLQTSLKWRWGRSLASWYISLIFRGKSLYDDRKWTIHKTWISSSIEKLSIYLDAIYRLSPQNLKCEYLTNCMFQPNEIK